MGRIRIVGAQVVAPEGVKPAEVTIDTDTGKIISVDDGWQGCDFLSYVPAEPIDASGMWLVPGGIGPHVPLRSLKQHPEYDRVVVILTRRLEYRKHPVRPVMENLARRLYRDYPNLLSVLLTEPERYAAERKELAELRGQGKIFLIEPETELDIGKLVLGTHER